SVLSDQVGVVGIVHSHDVEHYDHVDRLGRYWNRIICVTDFMMNKVKDINPSFVKRMRLIPYGIEVPEGWPERSLDGDKGAPIRLIYTGRLVQHQKRVRDLVKITKELTKRGVPHLLTVIGEGKESERLQQDWAQEIADGTVVMTGRLLKHEIVQALRQSDVFVLVSDFEGLPLSLLEAMAQGVPAVVSDQTCGIPDLVTDGETGFRSPTGDIQAFAMNIEKLAADRELLVRMSRMAHSRILNGFRDVGMVQSYERMLREVWSEIVRGDYRRPESLVANSPVQG